MSQKSFEPEMRCPICGATNNVRKLSFSKGVGKFFCAQCCVEIHIIPSKFVIEVYDIDEDGELWSICSVILL